MACPSAKGRSVAVAPLVPRHHTSIKRTATRRDKEGCLDSGLCQPVRWGVGQAGRGEERGRDGVTVRGTEREKFESTQQLGMGGGDRRGCVGASCTFLNLESTWAPTWAPGGREEGGHPSPAFHHTLLCLFHKAGRELRLHGPQGRQPLQTKLLGIPCGPEVGSFWSQVTQRVEGKARTGMWVSGHSAKSYCPGLSLALSSGEQLSCQG